MTVENSELHGSECDNGERHRIAHDEVLELYKLSASEIDGFKQRQWNTTNYVSLIYVALFSGFHIIIESCENKCYVLLPNEIIFISLFCAGLVAAVMGSRIIANLEGSIEVRRSRMKEARERYFTHPFRIVWAAGIKGDHVSLKKQFDSIVFSGCFLLSVFLLLRLFASHKI
mgnify:CR=1 FL=1